MKGFILLGKIIWHKFNGGVVGEEGWGSRAIHKGYVPLRLYV